MSNLSWLIYLAGVADGLGGLSLVTTIISGIIYAAWWVVKGVKAFDDEDSQGPPRKLLILALSAGFLTAVIPSQKTVYIIAASELGQAAYQSRVGQDLSEEAVITLKGILKDLRGEDKEKPKSK